MRVSLSIGWTALILLLAARVPATHSQTEPIEGIRENTPRVHALTNVRIVAAPGRVVENGTVILRDGIIEAAGNNVSIPGDARVWDYEGMTVYAGLIESYSHVGLEKKSKDDKQSDEGGGTGYWNSRVTPERNPLEQFSASEKDLEALRQLGFTSALVVPDKGIIQGTSALVALGDTEIEERVIRDRVSQCMSMEFSWSGDRSNYPNSLMGRIALIRQAMLDAQWYGAATEAYSANPSQDQPETNDALAALHDGMENNQPVLMTVDNERNLARAQRVADEFGIKLWIRGSGHEYRMADALAASKTPVIVTLEFPKSPNVDSPEGALEVTLAALQHWDAAPANAYLLDQAGVQFAFTTNKLKKSKDLYDRIRKAMERGLSGDAALAALTTAPAAMLGVGDQLGTIDRGKRAHLVVTDGDLFAKKTKIIDVWIDGAVHKINKRPEVDPRGIWDATIAALGDASVELKIEGEVNKLKGSITRDSTTVKLKKIAIDYRRMALSFKGDDFGVDGVVQMSCRVASNELTGHGTKPNGEFFKWTATALEEEGEDGQAEEEEEETPEREGYRYAATFPPGEYGFETAPERPRHVFVKGATIWTSGPDGRLEDADMHIADGKIRAVGRGLKAPSGAVVIDGAGKHITAGLIDAHSHSAANGSVNESAQAVTAEVRIADVIDGSDIALYRELAGGLTIANVLHGSANPIGGQNAVIKLKWGLPGNDLLMDGVLPGIKFALGENVKQSNWGDKYTTRYPQTRMGVEQIIRDRFTAALDYEREWKNYKKKKGVIPPRRDLELETLLEILRGERVVHCHSYRQDEILMLIRVAEDFGFQMGTFQHVLEGYKVADALAEHGAHASTFSDWWAYKFEVYDAIPYNGALMHDVGVVVSFNSDSGELARRMNLEAAKAVKYGGVSESEALKFVTLNPAIQLHVDDRVGSLEVGKDGDFAVWNGHPLSTYSKCEQTWIEGVKYFDIERDKQMRKHVAAERAHLIQKVLSDGDKKKKEMKSKKTAATREGGQS